jgi:hypothetical protein
MKVFVSWSGARSKAVATVLSDWVKCVLQATRPWISTRDIDRGALWFSEIGDQLKDTTVGIICLTNENKDRPWILFEAGALAKGLSSSRVCTFLIDLKPADLEDPLAQFNHTVPEHDGLWSLVRTLNGCLGSAALDERILEQVFATYWPQFKEKFDAAIAAHPAGVSPEPRSEQNLLSEILETSRALNTRIRHIEHRLERSWERPRGRVPRDPEVTFPVVSPESALGVLRGLEETGMVETEIVAHMTALGVPREWIGRHIASNREARKTALAGPSA